MNKAAYHVIEFVTDWLVEVERAPGRPLEQVLIRRGARRCARVRPRVLEAGKWPVEVADLYFDDGTVARGVPFAAFAFAD
jgi:hypothetical protein